MLENTINGRSICEGFQLSPEKLSCAFIYEPFYHVGTLYTCNVESLDNSNNNMYIAGYIGDQQGNKSDLDVKAMWIHGTNATYIPSNLGSMFNLTTLSIQTSQLVEVRLRDFKGMQNLEYLSLFKNNLTFLPSNVFTTLTKLKFISLHENQFEVISNQLFSNNLQLEAIQIKNNKVNYIGTEVFNGLTKLNFVDISQNTCLNKDYNGTKAIIQLKEDIKLKCKDPNQELEIN